MVTCELCGQNTFQPITIEVAGTKMQACNSCKHLGKIINKEDKTNLSYSFRKRKKHTSEQEVISNYTSLLNKALAQKGINLQQLAKHLNIKESSLNKYFSGKIKPDVQIALKLERFFEIKLLEDKANTDDTEYVAESNNEESNLSLGDLFLKKMNEKNKK